MGTPILNDPLYKASRLVTSCSGIPHLNSRLSLESSQFQWTEDYYLSLFGFPSILLELTCIILLVYKAILLYKTYCSGFCSRQASKIVGTGKCIELKRLIKCSTSESLEDQSKVYDRKIKSLLVLLFSMFVINCFVFLGNHQISSAFGYLSNSSNDLFNKFNAVAEESNQVFYVSEYLTSFANSSNCTGISSNTLNSILSKLTNVSYDAISIDNYASPIQDSVNSFTNLIQSFAVNRKDTIVIVFFCAIQFVCLWFGAAIHQQSSFYFRAAIFFTWWVLIGLAVMAIFFEQISIVSS